jgi:hypothetical protein
VIDHNCTYCLGVFGPVSLTDRAGEPSCEVCVELNASTGAFDDHEVLARVAGIEVVPPPAHPEGRVLADPRSALAELVDGVRRFLARADTQGLPGTEALADSLTFADRVLDGAR